ncbi:MAG TPA: DUF58 domain-containing protein [Acidimicrobiales bacterium]|nr:DUF58 domain-containing protein [Acidimicrobiales bacterium]
MALVALGAAARWGPLVVVGVGLLALLAGAAAYVVVSPRLALERAVEPPSVEKGQPAIAVIRAANLSWRSLAGLVIEQRLGDQIFRAELPRLRRGETGLRTYRLPTSRRGNYVVGPVELPKADPFGLCRRVRALGEPQVISVHPRVIPLRPLPSGASRNLEGPSSDTSPQGTVTFHRLREYVVGDDLRTVHWPSTARVGRLVVRHYVDTAQPYTVVLVDLNPSVYSPETFEEAMDVAASVATCVSSGRAPVQLRTTTGERVGGPTQKDATPLVQYLTDLAPSSAGSLSAELLPLRRDRGGSALVVVTGMLELESLPAVAALTRHFDHLIVASLVPRKTQPPTYPGVNVLVASTADELASAWDGGVAR